MGDISRHRDIYLNTRGAIPPTLLARCQLTRADLTYLEMGNYLTDVCQFRDPVTYIFAKRRVWRDKILPKVGGSAGSQVIQGLIALAALATSALLAKEKKGAYAALPLAVLPLQALASNRLSDALAGVAGLDGWIDRMLGKPFEYLKAGTTRRSDEEYGYIGQFFQHFIGGITHLLFADGFPNRTRGEWGEIDRISADRIDAILQTFFTQYYPHEHTDQPPYVWDASKRPRDKRYNPKRDTGGVMKIVDDDYIQYLAEGLSKLEHDWRLIRPGESEKKHEWMVRLGKILHGVEDWYFHSNIVELTRVSAHKPAKGEAEEGEAFLQGFVREELKGAATVLQRRLYRRLRFPVYGPADKVNTGGNVSKDKSLLSLNHAYPAFPSQQDTAHTLLAALENLEGKLNSAGGTTPTLSSLMPWAPCVLGKFILEGADIRAVIRDKTAARGVSQADFLHNPHPPGTAAHDRVDAARTDVLRELLPLVLVLLHKSERQRLVADVEPMKWPGRKQGKPGDGELNNQLKRHVFALQPKSVVAGLSQNNYQRAARYLEECGFINTRGRDLLIAAFGLDATSQAEAKKVHEELPGAGGFLMQFAVELEQILDAGEAETEKLNKSKSSIFDQASDNGAFTEIVGSHSLMSKDTLESLPFFDDAKVLASVASQSVFHIMLEEVGAPLAEKRLYWQSILRHFIRFPKTAIGWERHALAFFRDNRRIPAFADLPELAELKSARIPASEFERWRVGSKATDLEKDYIEVERKVSRYRYPQ